MFRNALLVGLLGVAAAATGCSHAQRSSSGSSTAPSSATVNAKDWLRSPAPSRRGEFATQVTSYRIRESSTNDAVRRLAATPFVVLTPEEARSLLDSEALRGAVTGLPVLLRVVLPESSQDEDRSLDDLQVLRDGNAVFVKYRALRLKDMPLLPSAVIALLPSPPGEVFVDAVTAIN
jgi:hypothetical protein